MRRFRIADGPGSRRRAASLLGAAVLVAGLVGPTVPARAAETSSYTVAPLQAAGAATFTVARSPDALNGAGLVAGYTGDSRTGNTHAAVLDTRTSKVRDLGTLVPGLGAAAVGVNIRGDVVGSARISPNVDHAFVIRAGTTRMIDLGVTSIGGGGVNSSAASINDHGVVAGWMDDGPQPGGHRYAVTWTLSGGTTFSTSNIGKAAGSTGSIALAVNNGGYVLFERYDKGQTWSFVWLPEHRYALQIKALPGDVQVAATDLNDAGYAVGASLPLRNGANRPILWSSQTRTTRALPVTAGRISAPPTAINAHNTVVGSELVVKDGNSWSRPVVWTRDGTSITDLPLGSSTTSEVFAINVYGTVVGQRGSPFDEGGGALWTPVPPRPATP